jgi:hypothetical protein
MRVRQGPSQPEPSDDDIEERVPALCATPIALITLVDAQRPGFKSRAGIDAIEVPRERTFCGQVSCADRQAPASTAAQRKADLAALHSARGSGWLAS